MARDTVDSLRRTCEGRYNHLSSSLYPTATCYEMTALGGAAQTTQDSLEKQYASLSKKDAANAVTPQTAVKARKLIAQRAEFLRRAQEVWKGESNEDSRRKERKLMASFDKEKWELRPDFPATERSLKLADVLIELSK